MTSQRVRALVAVLLTVGGAVMLTVVAIGRLPRGLITLVIVVLAGRLARDAILRRGSARNVRLAAALVLIVAVVVITLTGQARVEGLIAVALMVLGFAAARSALRVHARWEPADRPEHPVVVWNPRSGGGKALTHHLADEARKRGIEPLELRPGDDLEAIVRAAVERGADGLAAAGGDGTQALVAAIAAEHDLPFACIPAGTRNHFALDLGVDRNDVVGALDAFLDGSERRVDLCEVNGRVFVNNVSLGLYAEAVQREGYRDAKLRTILDTAPDVLGSDGGGSQDLVWVDDTGETRRGAAVMLVSNDVYRLGLAIGSGTRPRLDDGVLGVAVLSGMDLGHGWRQWSTPELRVDSGGPVPAGVDGEAMVLDPPLLFACRPRALRVRIARDHPGVSPSAIQPASLVATMRLLLGIAMGRGVSAGDGRE
jgi:diacylglycerol kinase family enzyme